MAVTRPPGAWVWTVFPVAVWDAAGPHPRRFLAQDVQEPPARGLDPWIPGPTSDWARGGTRWSQWLGVLTESLKNGTAAV